MKALIGIALVLGLANVAQATSRPLPQRPLPGVTLVRQGEVLDFQSAGLRTRVSVELRFADGHIEEPVSENFYNSDPRYRLTGMTVTMTDWRPTK